MAERRMRVVARGAFTGACNRTLLRRHLAVAIVVAAVAPLACGGNGNPSGPAGEIRLQLSVPILVPAQTAQLIASAVDAEGKQISGAALRYRSGTPSVISLDGTGVMHAQKTGTSTITVSGDHLKSADMRVAVEDGVWVTPTGGSFSALGGSVQLVIAPGSVSADRALPIATSSAPFPDPTAVVGSIYRVGADSDVFNVPVTLRLAFNAAGAPFGLPVDGLGVRQLNGGMWQDLPNGVIEGGGGAMRVTIASGGTFSVGRVLPALSCTSSAARAFDFWLGDWDVGTGGAPFARNRVTLEPGGCAIFEHYTDNGGTDGRSVNFYEPTSAKWYQTYVDNNNSRLLLSGVPGSSGRLAMKTGGATAYQEWVWTLLSPDLLTQVGATTADGGKTFNAPFWSGQYRRRP